ncbi:hypothetical protein OROMI_003681 [Orobanche minor]
MAGIQCKIKCLSDSQSSHHMISRYLYPLFPEVQIVPLRVLVLNILKFGGVLVSVWNLKLSNAGDVMVSLMDVKKTLCRAEAIIKDSVEPLLEEYRPPGITSLKFSQLSLGTVAPKIEGKMALDIIQYLLSAQSPHAKFRNEVESTTSQFRDQNLPGFFATIIH